MNEKAKTFTLYYNYYAHPADREILISSTDCNGPLHRFSVSSGILSSSDLCIKDVDNIALYSVREVYGIIGAFEFYPFGYFPLCITDCQLVSCKTLPHKVYEVKHATFPFIDFHNDDEMDNFSDSMYQDLSPYYSIKSLLESLANQKGLYFSDTKDLCQRNVPSDSVHNDFQLSQDENNSNNSENYYSKSFDRSLFCFNNHALSTIKCQATRSSIPFLLRLIQGFYSSVNMTFNNEDVCLELIYRRYQARNGRRFFCRGIDSNSDTANFMEHEVNMEYKDKKYVYYILRGSIPMFFSQLPFMLGVEKFKVFKKSEENVEDINKHLKKIALEYMDNIYLVSLIGTKNKEGKLYEVFSSAASSISSNNDRIKFINFDFHKETKGLHYENINTLLDQLNDFMQQNLYFEYAKGSKNMLNKQSGIIRVNCVDSLDRTGVIVNAIIRRVFCKWLVKEELLPSSTLENFKLPLREENFIRNTFADSSDYISYQYSGTGAIKTEFTRTGSVTILGKVSDIMISLTRKLMSLFSDPQTEDSYRLFLGKHDVGLYFRSRDLVYPYFNNLKSSEMVYLGLTFTMLFSLLKVVKNISHFRLDALPFLTLLSSGLILRRFNYDLILKPKILKE